MSKITMEEVEKESEQILAETTILILKNSNKHPLALISAFHATHLGLLKTLADNPETGKVAKELVKRTIEELQVITGDRKEIML